MKVISKKKIRKGSIVSDTGGKIIINGEVYNIVEEASSDHREVMFVNDDNIPLINSK